MDPAQLQAAITSGATNPTAPAAPAQPQPKPQGRGHQAPAPVSTTSHTKFHGGKR